MTCGSGGRPLGQTLVGELDGQLQDAFADVARIPALAAGAAEDAQRVQLAQRAADRLGVHVVQLAQQFRLGPFAVEHLLDDEAFRAWVVGNLLGFRLHGKVLPFRATAPGQLLLSPGPTCRSTGYIPWTLRRQVRMLQAMQPRSPEQQPVRLGVRLIDDHPNERPRRTGDGPYSTAARSFQ